jgi:hypothetical protein
MTQRFCRAPAQEVLSRASTRGSVARQHTHICAKHPRLRNTPSSLQHTPCALRPALEVEEEDRMNANRQEQVYTGRTLPAPEYVENVRKVRVQGLVPSFPVR